MRNVSSRIARSLAVLVLLAVTTQAVAAPVRERDRWAVREVIKRIVHKAFHGLGCPPGCSEIHPGE